MRGQRYGIFERHHRTLGEKWKHRMGRVADEGRAAVRPLGEWPHVVERPIPPLTRVGDERLQRCGEVSKLFVHGFGRSRRLPIGIFRLIVMIMTMSAISRPALTG